ncbi:hypothetical protein OWM54_41925 [Myxococcus sp. MISCRS1]|uniref:hypothetical protein n=1 Tax=Myxococcus sp. MISCRS1 TaxID=2996786 RepID=UPI00226D8CBD|nr:hypothetical protein [Myxococcus sp. MISCRS1]MCY1003723.1 hypothetical protein [Myxococcus sp. MISCRS1]
MARPAKDPITQARHRVAVLCEELELLEAELGRADDGWLTVGESAACAHRAAWCRWMLSRAEQMLRAVRLRVVNERMDRVRRPHVARRPPPEQLGLFDMPAPALEDDIPEADPDDVVEVPDGAEVHYLPRSTGPLAPTHLHIVGAA